MASLPTAVSIELIAEAGFDFVIIDTEHVLINPETIEHMIRTAESYELTPLVRVADSDPKAMLRLLDAGAQGIVLPNIEEAATLERVVAACRYAPAGHRSLNAGRPGSFGKYPLKDYVARANDQIMVVAMIESRAGSATSTPSPPCRGWICCSRERRISPSRWASVGRPDTPKSLSPCSVSPTAPSAMAYPIAPSSVNPIPRPTGAPEVVRVFMLGDERGIAFRALSRTLDSARSLSGDMPS